MKYTEQEFIKEFVYDVAVDGTPLSVTKTYKPLWDWIEQYGKEQRTDELNLELLIKHLKEVVDYLECGLPEDAQEELEEIIQELKLKTNKE